ncbi:MAG: family 78 glycoside hydrolase catalytic domain [Bacteroidetes bacterium]|nr:family 78 glycoside hydrolase catalytic domain [Bacteroidota bacterium]
MHQFIILKTTCLKKNILTLLFFLIGATCFAASSLQIKNMLCEYSNNPLGIDISRPRFSWELLSVARNQSQSGFELIVSSSLKNIQQGSGDIWSTGKLTSSATSQIEYGGTPLQSFTRYYWRVKVYDQNNEYSMSDISWFETAMMSPEDWTAKWINDGSVQPAKDEDYYKDDRMPLFRREFVAKKLVSSARLYICGLGYYEAYLNGNKIGDHVLDPGFTTYHKQAQYVSYDITTQIKKGKNAAGIMLGNGWYNPLPIRLFGRIDLRKWQQTGRPCVKAEMHIRYVDGSTDIIATDQTWQTTAGPILRNNVYLGEKYDARLEQRNWNMPEGNASVWKDASIARGPSGQLTTQMQPAIKITKVLKPISISESAKDTFIVDLGQNFAGVARIKLKGAAGTKISLRYGEDIYSNGALNYMTTVCTQIKKGRLQGGPGAPETAWQEDNYIMKGDGIETWSPRFTFHGFRYIEITGWPGKPTVNDIEGLRMNSDLQSDGNFACSNEMFNKLHENILWTFLSNVFSVQSDCPGREKMGYGADIVVSGNTFLYNFNMANFYSKALHDYANEQQWDGSITEIAPYTGIADRGYGGQSGPLGWELAFPYLQKLLYEYYGDKRVIENNYEAFKKQIEFLQSKATNGLFYWDIGDHETLDTKAEAFSASSFYYHHVALAAEFAHILGRDDDAAKFEKLAKQIKTDIVSTFLVPHTGRFDNATQAAQIFALYYNFSPEKDSTFKVLMNEFARHNWHLYTGIFATKMVFDVLRENDRNDIAYTLANQRTYPGWGYMIANGASTLWESWEKPDDGPSMNHPMFGSVDEWFYKSILGINAASPGFKKIIIKPQPAGDLKWAKGSYHAMSGNITSGWKIENGRFVLQVSIPANTKATVYIPSSQKSGLMESNSAFNDARYENGYLVAEIGSGNYAFSAPF